MREIYETEDDVQTAFAIAREFERATGRKLKRLGLLECVDYAIYEGELLEACAEVKRRRIPFRKYPDIILSVQKVKEARKLQIACIFVVQFDDCTMWADMLTERPIRTEGRRDRNDSLDLEPCYCIPAEEFFPLERYPVDSQMILF